MAEPLVHVLARLRTELLSVMPLKQQRWVALSQKLASIELSSVADLNTGFDQEASEYDLVLKKDVTLEHCFRIPKLGASELSRIVRLEATRVMPIEIDKLELSYSKEEIPGTKEVQVTLVAARKVLVYALLDRSAAIGKKVRAIGAMSTKGNLYFSLPALNRRRYMRNAMIFFACLSLCSIVVVAPRFYLDKVVAAMSETDAALRDARKNTAKIAGLQKQVESLQSLSASVLAVRDQSQIVELFETLTKASPDEVVVSEFRLDGRQLFLSGWAQKPEEWVIALQKNNAFKDVRLTSVLGETQGQKHHFELYLSVQWPAERTEL